MIAVTLTDELVNTILVADNDKFWFTSRQDTFIVWAIKMRSEEHKKWNFKPLNVCIAGNKYLTFLFSINNIVFVEQTRQTFFQKDAEKDTQHKKIILRIAYKRIFKVISGKI